MLNAKLVVVGGDAKTTEVKLKFPCILGRGKGATLILPHPLVSRQHCELFEANGRLMVRDLGSLNGTYVNNEKVAEAVVPAGQLLTVGSVTFRAVYQSEEDNGPPQQRTTVVVLPTDQKIESNHPTARAAAKLSEPVPTPEDEVVSLDLVGGGDSEDRSASFAFEGVPSAPLFTPDPVSTPKKPAVPAPKPVSVPVAKPVPATVAKPVAIPAAKPVEIAATIAIPPKEVVKVPPATPTPALPASSHTLPEVDEEVDDDLNDFLNSLNK